MNPSASGWVKKFLTLAPKSEILDLSQKQFYKNLKLTGFVYGSNINCISKTFENTDFNEDERCKINLLSAFYYIHQTKNNRQNFTKSVVEFYKITHKQKRSFLSGLFGEPEADILLETIIHKRIHIDENFITKNFSYFLINAFLFIDVIGYYHFISGKANTKTYIKKFEAILEHAVFSVLEAKQNKTVYDANLIKLFEASIKHKVKNDSLKSLNYAEEITNDLEKSYIIDIACMASWSDKQIDNTEFIYLNELRKSLNIEANMLLTAIDNINDFYEKNKDKVVFLSAENLAQSFYNNSSKFVIRLIKRNGKRIIKELSQSKDAMYLLTQSTTRNLTDDEQKQVQNQLLDIFKSIPSLAIFMLPGGMILLPLFVKLIPKLLPSSFDENRIED